MHFFDLAPYPRTASTDLKPVRSGNLIAALIFIFFLGIAMPPLVASNSGPPRPPDDGEVPWHISADEIIYDKNLDNYIAQGNVSITQKDKKLTADFARFDQANSQVLAHGHVIMMIGEDVLMGERVEMDLKSETGTLYNGTVFLKAHHFYIKGDKIQKVGPYAYSSDTACVTTCDDDPPAWEIKGKNLKVTLEGYGFAKHTALRVKTVPVLYSPWLVFPVKLKRQSGLLPPQFGYSDRKGFEYTQPLFWAINPSSDATFYLNHMQRRGEKPGFEYRYVLDDSSKGSLMLDVLNDRQVDDGRPENEDWGYTDDNILRPNSDRYWFRLKHDQSLPLGWFARLDLDIASDQDYLTEFKDGYTGFDETNNYFNDAFGRDLDPYDDSVRSNRLNISRGWERYNLNAELRWYDNIVNRRQQDSDPTLQTLPFIEFNAAKQQIFRSMFYFDLDSEYDYFYRKDGQRGHRMDLYPRFYLPYRYENYFSVEPSLGLRETVWHLNEHNDGSRTQDATQYRELYDFKLDLSSEIFKIYDGFGNTIERLKHVIRPQIVYQYTPDKRQESLPLFNDVDRIQRQNMITYSLTNTFTARSLNPAVSTAASPNQENAFIPAYTYDQFCRFKLEQSYDINEAQENDSLKWANPSRKQPFTPIYGEIEFAPTKYFYLQADAQWSTYESAFLSHNIAANLSDNRADNLFIEYRFNENQSESIYTDVLLSLSDRLAAFVEYEQNLHDDKLIKYSIAFIYKSQCWSVDFGYAYEDGKKIALMFNLYGLGGVGAPSTIQSRLPSLFR